MNKLKNNKCKYFPCHEGMDDCSLCYCPLYPCHKEKRGKFIKINKKKIWDCSGCSIVHQKDVAERLIQFMDYNNWKNIE